MPLIDERIIKRLIDKGQKNLAVLTFIKEDPKGYGRIVREHNQIKKIVEENILRLEPRKENIIKASTK